MTDLQIPASTYRLHLTHEFTLHDAAALVPHLQRLGVDWAYASPIQTVPEGATHGYHITDPDTVNPELGGEDGLAALHAALQDAGLGLVLDIVPNHMAASPANAWWRDLLANGPDSPHARTFDVDLDAGPLVLPVLGEPAHEAAAAGDLRVEGDELVYHDLRLPLAEGTDTAAPIEQVLESQHYRLHDWQDGERQLNWRRFFAVNDLAGVRVEDPEVFDAVHAAILRWVDEGVVQGLRVDHVDGLRDPDGYLTELRHRLGAGRWLVVEKILEQGEQVPRSWPIQGTTGYEVNAALTAWLTDREGHQALRRAYADLVGPDVVGEVGTAGAALPASELAQLDALFPAEVARVVALLRGLDGAPGGDELRDGVRHLTAHLGGYRTYVRDEGEPGPADVTAIRAAAEAAEAAGCPAAARVADLLLSPAGRPALMRWQQLTGPSAAKGFEDRLLFRHVALAALCEVGADAHLLDQLPDDRAIAAFLVDRAATSPAAGTTTSTHDTKRSEDVRARLVVLAEQPSLVTDLLSELQRHLADAPDPGPHARWLATQTVLGSLGLEPGDLDGGDGPLTGTPTASYRDRVVEHLRKALREAEVATRHRDPDEAYERDVERWVTALLAEGPALDAVLTAVRRIAVAGMSNSLATVVLKVAGPGVPDVYRGCEVLDGSLTDPDNRRPLDVQRITRLLDAVDGADAAEVRDVWHDGRLKLLVTHRALQARRRLREVLGSTELDVPDVVGEHADHVLAIHRRAADRGPEGTASPDTHPDVLALAVRGPLALGDGGWPVGDVWADTTLPVDGDRVVDVLTGAEVPVRDGRIRLADALATLPAALLEIR